MCVYTSCARGQCVLAGALTQEAKYVERWPNTTSAWAGWSRFDIPGDRYGGVHSLLICTAVHWGWGLLPATRLASREILVEQNIKKRTGPALCVLCGANQFLSAIRYTQREVRKTRGLTRTGY